MGISKAGREFKLQVQDYVIANCVPKMGDKRLQMEVTLRHLSTVHARHQGYQHQTA